MRILGLDTGESMGWGLIEASSRSCEFIECGEFVVSNRTQPILTFYRWLLETVNRHEVDVIAHELLLICTGRGYCTKIAAYLEGAIVLTGQQYETGYISKPTRLPVKTVGYNNKTIKSAIGAKDKVEVRQIVQHYIGREITTKADHPSDAVAVAMTYALRELRWIPSPDKPLVLKKRRQIAQEAKAREREEFESLDPEHNPGDMKKLLEGIQSGKIKPRRR